MIRHDTHARRRYYAIMIALNVLGILFLFGRLDDLGRIVAQVLDPILAPITSLLAPVDDWLIAHDVLIDLITIWSLVVGFALYGIIKIAAWLTLRKQRDRTMVGISLKRQKLTEALVALGMSSLYSMTLIAYYLEGDQFSFVDRLILRVSLLIVMFAGSVTSIQFIYYLRRESRRDS